MQRYHFPSNIEVSIPGDYKPRQEKANARHTANHPTTPAKKSLRYLATRSIFVVCGLATLGNIPVYSMVSPPDSLLQTAEPTNTAADPTNQMLLELNLPAIAVETYAGFAVDILPDAEQGSWKIQKITSTDSLKSVLDALKVTNIAKPILENNSISTELAELNPDTALLVQVVDGHIQQLIYAKGKKNAYIVTASDNGFVGKWEDGALEIRESARAVTIKHSLERDAQEAGFSKSLIRQLGHVFRQDVNFKGGIKTGDQIGVVFEDYQYQGASIYTDKILAAEYTSKGTTYQRIRFALADGKTDYYQPDADTALKRTAFDRVPIKGGRMSSGFGMRRHPVFGFRKAHMGQDFAAPRGTPIYATADGQVKFVGRQGGYGNVVELRHIEGISTLYGHMSAFKAGLGHGDSVKRGDIIGYVGSTGTSTGNHVHYEFHVNGVAQNPMAVSLPTTGVMTASEVKAFKHQASTMLQQLAELRKLASADKPKKDEKAGS